MVSIYGKHYGNAENAETLENACKMGLFVVHSLLRVRFGTPSISKTPETFPDDSPRSGILRES